MDDVMPTIQALARRIDANGHRSAGYNRELYIELGGDRGAWVTYPQEPILARLTAAKKMQTKTEKTPETPLFRPANAAARGVRYNGVSSPQLTAQLLCRVALVN